ncbi:hypothetical protein IMCC21906_01773 [Spongiibacter sp. IMCC21906]|uniref:hypothetical protein n=1 Tax=Spongiibacter sp. IMCC21906 TaxID=1620392 RepID=UPI00062DD816|nr:hypothetical protein [Spongiibacter sp. IMCC21906]AKH69448.1 hypothetical protein IMCC21906_01773 [Spongiibacter sp. IMCC21906]
MSLHPNFDAETAGRPLRELPSTDNFLVICIRLWAQEHCHDARTESAPDWRSGFAAVGLSSSAQQHFNTLLAVIFTASRPAPMVKYYACPVASPDEHWLLACVTLAQHDNETRLNLALAERLSESNQQLVVTLLRNLSQAMLDAGLHLSRANTAALYPRLHIYRSASVASTSQTLH